MNTLGMWGIGLCAFKLQSIRLGLFVLLVGINVTRSIRTASRFSEMRCHRLNANRPQYPQPCAVNDDCAFAKTFVLDNFYSALDSQSLAYCSSICPT